MDVRGKQSRFDLPSCSLQLLYVIQDLYFLQGQSPVEEHEFIHHQGRVPLILQGVESSDHHGAAPCWEGVTVLVAVSRGLLSVVVDEEALPLVETEDINDHVEPAGGDGAVSGGETSVRQQQVVPENEIEILKFMRMSFFGATHTPVLVAS